MQGLALLALSTLLASQAGSTPQRRWQVYAFHDGSFHLAVSSFGTFLDLDRACESATHRAAAGAWTRQAQEGNWHVTTCMLADVTGDTLPEWVLVVWRPWRDWPIQRWSSAPSRIAGFHDARGDSCHLILLDPQDGRQLWAGSALAAPLVKVAAGDVDGDAHNEVVALEGDYLSGRDGPATRINVWRWNGFGFTSEWHSPPDVLHQLCLTDVDGDSILDVVTR